MNPYLEDPDLTLYQGDALEVLKTLPDGSVHMCVTSPPFYGLRDYGTGSWVGGDEDCDHIARIGGKQGANGNTLGKDASHPNRESLPATGHALIETQYRSECGKCGARRVDQQIGLEETPEQWVEKLVAVFREVRRVLRADGTCWVEVGDSYASAFACERRNVIGEGSPAADVKRANRLHGGLKNKDLIGAPWMLAFALRADGWFLRSDIVWSRPNPMPESVTDRPTKSHSYVFLLSKSPRYFFDQEAVREKWADDRMGASGVRHGVPEQYANDAGRGGDQGLSLFNGSPDSGRNVRSVWQIATQPYPEAHFATYPEELVRRCILAGSSERGCCPECGAPWVREIEPIGEVGRADAAPAPSSVKAGLKPQYGQGRRGAGTSMSNDPRKRIAAGGSFIGWQPSCNHAGPLCPDCGFTHSDDHHQPDPVPCTVLDPFFGSGTTGLVARKHGRQTIGIELSSAYCELAAVRLQQLSLLTEGA